MFLCATVSAPPLPPIVEMQAVDENSEEVSSLQYKMIEAQELDNDAGTASSV